MPPWFFEGDAVFTETLLSNAGRGRMPYFEGQYRALLLTGNSLNYEKNSAGSYKKLIPNIYNMGYLPDGIPESRLWRKASWGTYFKKL